MRPGGFLDVAESALDLCVPSARQYTLTLGLSIPPPWNGSRAFCDTFHLPGYAVGPFLVTNSDAK